MPVEGSSPADRVPSVSIVVPVHNEAENIPVLADEIAAALKGRRFEAIFVNDGSSDETSAVLRKLGKTRPWLRQIKHARSCGQSAAVRSGVRAARAPVVVTLDGDGQNDPSFIPKLLIALEAAPLSVGLVNGQRLKRKGGFKRLQSTIANSVRAAVLRDDTRDTGCGLKAFRRDVYLALPYFDALHRFTPGAGQARGLRRRLCRGGRPPARARQKPLRHVEPAVDRHPRSHRRFLVDPAPPPRAGSDGGTFGC